LNLAELEAEAFLLGHWKNFDELESNLSMVELQAILKAARERQWEQNKFTAALKGIKLDGAAGKSDKERFEEVVSKAKAQAAGKSEDQFVLEQVGVGVEEE
jgi:hypothetical protein